MKFGFDRAGTSTAVETVEEKKLWSKAEGTLAVADVGDAMIPSHTRRGPSVLIFAQAGCQPPGNLSGGVSARLLPVARPLAREGRWLERRGGTVRRGYRRWAQRRVRCRPPEGREPKHG